MSEITESTVTEPPREAIWFHNDFEIPVTAVAIDPSSNGEVVYQVEQSHLLEDGQSTIPAAELKWIPKKDELLQLTDSYRQAHRAWAESESVEPLAGLLEEQGHDMAEPIEWPESQSPEFSNITPLQPTHQTPDLITKISETIIDGSRRASVWWKVRSSEYKRNPKSRRVALGVVAGATALVAVGYIAHKYNKI